MATEGFLPQRLSENSACFTAIAKIFFWKVVLLEQCDGKPSGDKI